MTKQTPHRVLIISDAWHPQINGVVRTLEATIHELEKSGYEVTIIAPGQDGRRTVPMPFYHEIRLEPFAGSRIASTIKKLKPDYIHIATEGPLGQSARRYCLAHDRIFTTAYHTCFPEYIGARLDKFFILRGWASTIAVKLVYRIVRKFHNAASAVMVATPDMTALLHKNNVAPDRLMLWSRGVDMARFKLGAKDFSAFANMPRPIALSVGRVAIEKNLRAFLIAPFSGSKVIVGDGPQLAELRAEFPTAHFLGAISDPDQLAACYRSADLFVFPSKTDTFGLVLTEAMASGLPVAACIGPGQNAIFSHATDHSFYRLNDNIGHAMQQLCVTPIAPEIPRNFVLQNYSWAKSTQEFIAAMQATTPPLQAPFWHRLIFDWIIGIPLQWIMMLPGIWIFEWGGKKLLYGSYHLWENRHRKLPPDDFS